MSSAATTAQLSDNSDLISSLNGLNKKLVKSSTYSAPADPSIQVRSWKMNEYKYYDVPSPFPTLARGLFTTEREIPDNEKEGKASKVYEIVARGYDKFFNIGEVPWTTVGFFYTFFLSYVRY
jgi:tRNA ligase